MITTTTVSRQILEMYSCLLLFFKKNVIYTMQNLPRFDFSTVHWDSNNQKYNSSIKRFESTSDLPLCFRYVDVFTISYRCQNVVTIPYRSRYVEDTQGPIRSRKSRDNAMNKRKRTQRETIAHKCMEEMKNVHVFIFIFLQQEFNQIQYINMSKNATLTIIQYAR